MYICIINQKQYHMPNWCDNRLEVSGDTKELKKFLAMGITEENLRYGKSEQKELVWRMSNYHPTPEPLTRTISPARDAEWTNEWEVNHAKKRIEEQPMLIAKLEAELETATGDDKLLVKSQLEEAKKPIKVPELIPCANGTEKDRKALIKKYGTDNWYDWNVNNWGTKWDCDSQEQGYDTDNETYFAVNFNSAWSPPMGWFAKVVSMFPTLKFKLTYMETGCWFAGVAFGQDGEIETSDGEPEYQDENGVVFTYNSETGMYVGANGEEIDEEEWSDSDCSYPVNPFEEIDAPWEM